MIPDSPGPVAETTRDLINHFRIPTHTSYHPPKEGKSGWYACHDCGLLEDSVSVPDGFAAAVVHSLTCGKAHDSLSGDAVKEMKQFLKPHIDAVLADQEQEHTDEVKQLRDNHAADLAKWSDTLSERQDTIDDQAEQITTLEDRCQQLDAAIEGKVLERIEKDLVATDAQIANSNHKPGLVLAAAGTGVVVGLDKLTVATGPAAIVGATAAVVGIAAVALLTLAVLPKISRKWGVFGMVAAAAKTPEELVADARAAAADPDALADATKLHGMARIAMAKNRLVRWGMIVGLAVAAPRTLAADLLQVTR